MRILLREEKSRPRCEIGKYFQRRGWKPFPFQKTCWRMYQAGDSGIVHSATGTGKTLAVWLGPILKWVEKIQILTSGIQATTSDSRTLITPIRALASDTEFNLRDQSINLAYRKVRGLAIVALPPSQDNFAGCQLPSSPRQRVCHCCSLMRSHLATLGSRIDRH